MDEPTLVFLALCAFSHWWHFNDCIMTVGTTTGAHLSSFWIVIATVPALIIGAFLGSYTRREMKPILRETLSFWAEKNEFQLSRVELTNKGPFAGAVMNSQCVYQIVVTDKNGTQRKAWARVSNWPTQNRASNVEVRWDDSVDNTEI